MDYVQNQPINVKTLGQQFTNVLFYYLRLCFRSNPDHTILSKSGKLAARTQSPDSSSLKFASWNIDGFDKQSAWAIKRAIDKYVMILLYFVVCKFLFQDIQVFALSETHHRHDVPRQRCTFDGFSSWHADRSGKDKVNDISYSIRRCCNFRTPIRLI